MLFKHFKRIMSICVSGRGFTVSQTSQSDSIWLRSKQKQKIKIRQKTFGQKEFDLGSINAGYDLAIVKLYVSASMSSEYSYKKRERKRGKMV